MKRIMVVILLAAGLVMTGCDLTGGGPDYFPMTVGSSWSYRGYVRLRSGTDEPPDTIQTLQAQAQATRRTSLVAGGEVTEFVTTTQIQIRYPFDTSYTAVETTYHRETGNLILCYESLSDNEPDTSLVLPLVRDKTWRVNEAVTARVIGQEDVTVPAGVYRNAWKIEYTYSAGGQSFTQQVWYAGNVGLVKVQGVETYGAVTYEHSRELTSATIR